MRINNLIKNIQKLDVLYRGSIVGTLAENREHRITFSYDDDWIDKGFSISPFSLPLKQGVFVPEKNYFDGLFGVFADSLPDRWGRLLLNRYLVRKGIPSESITPLIKLALSGELRHGALSYQPSIDAEYVEMDYNLDELASECIDMLKTDADIQHLDLLYKYGGSSGGTRPKININIDGSEWIIKFPSHLDSPDIGIMEQAYAKCARSCGINIAESRLFPSDICGGYFGTKRFDRDDAGNEIHMVSVAGLLELDYEQPSLDYTELMKLVKIMTSESKQDVLQAYRLMCFNVYAHNQDDHTKNFSFLYDDNSDTWQLSQAYDLTYSTTYYKEHTTSVAGTGKNPGDEDILKVAKYAGISKNTATRIKDEIKEIVFTDLSEYLTP